MTRGLTPVFALLMFGGMWGWRRVWARRDLQPLFYVCLAVLAGTALDLWYVQVSCPRYAFTIVLLGSPFAALGLLGLRDRCLRFAERRRLSAAGRGLAAAIPALALVLPLGELASKGYAHRGVEADLGHWLRSQFGPQRTLVGPAGVTHAVSYYADARCVVFPFEADAATVSSMVKRYRPDIVLLRPSRRIAAEEWDPLLARLRRLGFAEACPNPLPDGYRSLRVLVPATGTTLGGKDQPGPATSKRTAWSMTTHGSRPPPPAAPPRGACSPGASRSSTGPRRRARA
jgi:hypothetical protein